MRCFLAGDLWDGESENEVEEDINDVIEDENDDKVNVADDDEIKHEASLT